eukprot:scaffold4891_cov28-Attheya_sp.AAC.3
MFSHNVSICMLANEHFFTMPDYNPSMSRQDLLIIKNPNSFMTATNVAPGKLRENSFAYRRYFRYQVFVIANFNFGKLPRQK